MLISWRLAGRQVVGVLLASVIAGVFAAWLRLDPSSIARLLPPAWHILAIGVVGTSMVGVATFLGSFAKLPEWAVWLGVALIALGQVLISIHTVVIVGGIFVLAGAVITAASGSLGSLEREHVLSKQAQHVLLGLCFLIALGLRLYQLDQVPFGLWRDEARHGLLALRILNDATFRPVYVPGEADLPALLFYLQTLPIRVLGPTTFAVRLIPALAGSFQRYSIRCSH
jgi:hypothetical protein